MTRHARHLFLPHHTNNFRARILHLDFFAVYLLIFVFIVGFSRFVETVDPNILGFATDITSQKLLEFTNQKRQESGIAPLRFDPQLSSAASAKAADMFRKDYWAHNAPDGATPWDFINGVGYVYTVAGENLAKNFSDSQGVVEAWMNSPSHRENLLRNQYEDVGFAIVNGTLSGEETTLVVQMFGKRLAGVPAPKSRELAANPFVASVQAANESTPAAQVQEGRPVDVSLPGATQYLVKSPFLDIRSLSRKIALVLSTILLVTLVVDSLYIWRHRIVRVGGKGLAHIIFLISLTGVAWIVSIGSIL